MTFYQAFYYPALDRDPGDRYSTTNLVSCENTKGISHVPFSRHFFCPKCGTVWAKSLIAHEDTIHVSYPHPCPEHGLGSILIDFATDYVNNLPQELILYELEIFARNPDKYHWPY